MTLFDFIEEHIIHRFEIPKTITIDNDTVFTGRKMVRYVESGMLSY